MDKEAFEKGFREAAAEHGVDPEQLMKIAQQGIGGNAPIIDKNLLSASNAITPKPVGTPTRELTLNGADIIARLKEAKKARDAAAAAKGLGGPVKQMAATVGKGVANILRKRFLRF